MKLKKLIFLQIKNLTTKLLETSFQIDFNYPSDKNETITWSGYKDISFTLKNQPYIDIYNECVKERAFNLMLLDGAIIQLMYEFQKDKIIKQRLAYYPSPNNDKFQDSPNDFEEIHFGNQLFSDMYENNVIVFPLRFDYDSDVDKFVEFDHSFSHLTIGNYSNCRIPVSRPITPNKFILFVLRSFYFDKFKKSYTNEDFKCNCEIESTITEDEAGIIHINS